MSPVRRILSALTALFVCLLANACGEEVPWLAPLNPAFVDYMAGKTPGPRLLQTEQGHALGHIPPPVPPERRLPGLRLAASPSDPAYDMRDPDGDGDTADSLLPPVRNQGGCGACWSFGTYGAFESHLEHALAETGDFSEDNLKHLHGFVPGPCAGGNLEMSTAYLARHDGPISEADDPYDQAADSDYCTDCDPVRYVDNVLFLPTRAGPTDNGYIKQAVVDYGGLYTTLYWDGAYYNSEDMTYYYGGSGSNHAVVIVGWDDDKYVSMAPAGSRYGAFIVRNSWGSSWGDGGYFYVSYCDGSIAYSALGHFDERPESSFSFDRVYAYDPLGRTGAIGYITNPTVAWGANWFVPVQDETLTAVGFYAMDTPTDYEIYINEAFGGGSFSDLRATQTGTVPHPGWYTVELDTPVALLEGDGFGVVIKFTTDDYGYPVALESPVGGYSSGATANPGESYISSSGSSWTDMTSTAYSESNVCIKAFCSDPEVPPIPLPAPGAYGRIPGGDQTHVEEVDYSFDGTPGDVTIVYEVYDADFADEVEILVNGVSLGYAETTQNVSWSGTRCIVIPDAEVLDAEANLLSFSNTFNPPNTYVWGVRNVAVSQACCGCMPLPDTGSYGRIVGGDQTHVEQVDYSFEGIPGDVTIRYQAWDVDFAEEVEILVNGVPVGYAPVTANENWGESQYVVVPDAVAHDSASNEITFSNTYNPPRTYWWGVRNVSVYDACPDCVPLPDAGAYGRIVGGDQTHVEEVDYSFEGTAGDVVIAYQIWDVDFATEVEILVNGVSVDYAPVTLNESWSGLLYITLPDDAVFDHAGNVLTFDNTYNPPLTYWWGVRDVSVYDGCTDCIPLPSAEACGRISGGDETHVNEVNYSFGGETGDVTVYYEVWDVDFSTEVEILVNGQSAGFAPVTPNNSWGSTESVVLPDAWVDDFSENVLTFTNTYNPPNTYWWGVRNVSIP